MSDVTITEYIDYVTRDGDAFDSIALVAYNSEYYADLLMKANPDYCDTLIFGAGVTLRVPVIDTSSTPDTLPPWRRGDGS